MHLKHRKTCRVCGSEALTPVIDLGYQYLQGSFIHPDMESPPLRTIRCNLVRCDPTRDENACGLLQMEKSVPPEILYSNYWYASGTNRTMTEHLRGIAESAMRMVGVAEPVVLDIGCNDGTLLGFYPDTAKKFGIDPSDVAREIPGITLVRDIFPSCKLDAAIKGRKCNIITSIAMFYDLEDPVAFAKRVGEMLSPWGVWVFEMSYMPRMLEMNSYDTLCSEHIEYYSLAVIEDIMAYAGLKVVKVEENSINGGSLRCYATHVENFKLDDTRENAAIASMRRREFDLALDTDKPYADFQRRIEIHREKLSGLLKEIKARGKRIHAYGASTKGNTILQWCGINNSIIDMAADRNPKKHGCRTIGTNIPIVSEAESRALKPDVYLVLPWHFMDEFVEREMEILASGTRMIFPLPEVTAVKLLDGKVIKETL